MLRAVAPHFLVSAFGLSDINWASSGFVFWFWLVRQTLSLFFLIFLASHLLLPFACRAEETHALSGSSTSIVAGAWSSCLTRPDFMDD